MVKNIQQPYIILTTFNPVKQHSTILNNIQQP